MQDVRAAASALRLDGNGVIPASAVPITLPRRGVGAGAAVRLLCQLVVMAELVRRAELTLEPARIGTDGRRHPLRLSNADHAVAVLLRHRRIKAHALAVETVVVLIHDHVKRAVDARCEHIKLHLHEVGRLRLLDALFRELGEVLRVHRLELGDMPLALCAWHAAFDDAVDAPARVPAKADAALADACLVDIDADHAQVAHERRLLILAAAEDAQGPTGDLLPHRPAEGQPQPAVAGMARYRAAEVLAGLVVILADLLVRGINQRGDGITGRWDLGHCSLQWRAHAHGAGCRLLLRPGRSGFG